MFRYISLQQQLIDERKKNAVLKAQTEKNAADIDYIAMISDIELESFSDDEAEVEADEQ